MASNNSSSAFSSSSYSYSSSSTSSSTVDGQTSGHRSITQSFTNPDGTTTTRAATQNLGEPIVQETRQYDAQGRELLLDNGSGAASGENGGVRRRIEDVSDDKAAAEQAARDREYEERIEEEYAKREGGA